MINYQQLKNWVFPEIEHTYTTDDSIRYALALGVGSDPMNEQELRFVNDTVASTPIAMPTMAVVLGFPGSWMQNPATGIDFPQIVHGEELVVLHKALPVAGTVVARHTITRIVDKGPGRGATVTYEKLLFDKASGDKLATVTHTTFARGNGGFSVHDGITDASLPPPAKVPEREPDQLVDVPTLPQQALMYRLCADRNPLHSEPAVAVAAGFARPILHGLCTYGVASRAILRHCCDYQPERFKSLFARFSAPVFPGETIRVEMYREKTEESTGGSTGHTAVQFRAIAIERGKVVLDAGRAEIALPEPSLTRLLSVGRGQMLPTQAMQ